MSIGPQGISGRVDNAVISDADTPPPAASAAEPQRSRRAQRPATDGVPEGERTRGGDLDDIGDTDAVEDDRDERLPESWWREQRPPHWE